MLEFKNHRGLVVPLDCPNVDTDQIIPKQFLRSISRVGFGAHLFDSWRYMDNAERKTDVSLRKRNPDFILNKDRYRDATILLAQDNFGCGSSREHAVWALMDYGVRVVLAPSFGDIFRSNALQNGLLTLAMPADIMERLFGEVETMPGYQMEVNLVTCKILTDTGYEADFEIDETSRHRLLNGLDNISITLQYDDAIKKYEHERHKLEPWVIEPSKLSCR